MLDNFSNDRNINYGQDDLDLEEKESYETVNKTDIEEPFEIRHVLEELPKAG